jgi:hypothetical protein
MRAWSRQFHVSNSLKTGLEAGFSGVGMELLSKRGGRVLLLGLVSVFVLSACGNDYDMPTAQAALPDGTGTPPPTSSSSAPNTPPKISGSMPGSVEVGKAFSFVPTATDAERDTLKFKITSKPSWATFDPATGRLMGTPKRTDVGSHEDIVISVTDGKATASLPKASVSVSAAAAASAVDVTISWEPPTQNTDGSAAKLSGYKLYYGKASQQYSKSVAITNAGLTRYVLEDLTPGKYFFSIAAVSSAGIESPYSPEVSGEIG